MPATRCLTASTLEIGMKHQAKLSFSHEQVERYCELSGDMNAIHRDVAAAQLRFPDVKDIVVPGGPAGQRGCLLLRRGGGSPDAAGGPGRKG